MIRIACLVMATALAGPAAAQEPQTPPVAVGSKAFTESVVLGELVTQLVGSAGVEAVHRRELGGSRILFSGLRRGDIDAYPEYTGTLRGEILADLGIGSDDELRRVLSEQHGILMTSPLGFNNTYAIGVTRATAERLGLRTISDLAAHPELRLGFSNEFMDRGDGWPGLRAAYGLTNEARGIEHSLAYRALESGDIGAMDLYSTDAEIEYYDLVVLDDDRRYFPRYDAVVIYRSDLATRHPRAAEALHRLEGAIDAPAMSAMNRLAKIGRPGGSGRVPEAHVAREFIEARFGLRTGATAESRWQILGRTTGEHLELVTWSMAAAMLVAVSLGVIAARWRLAAGPILWVTGILQTMPSLALLALLIRPFGLGTLTAIVALFLYSLLPIVRNTYAGLSNIPGDVLESARAIGLSRFDQLRDVELPMALPTILAGVKTAVVINVGTATLAALIGAGGYGQPILTGIRLDDFSLILLGAAPAAIMAIGAQLLFDGAERVLVSRGLRL